MISDWWLCLICWLRTLKMPDLLAGYLAMMAGYVGWTSCLCWLDILVMHYYYAVLLYWLC
jgi:hypothetical protein